MLETGSVRGPSLGQGHDALPWHPLGYGLHRPNYPGYDVGKLNMALPRIQTFPSTIDIKKTALERCVHISLVYKLKFANRSLVTFRTSVGDFNVVVL